MIPDEIRLFDVPLNDLSDGFPKDSDLVEEGVLASIRDAGVDAAWMDLGATTGMDRALRIVIRRAADLWVVVEESPTSRGNGPPGWRGGSGCTTVTPSCRLSSRTSTTTPSSSGARRCWQFLEPFVTAPGTRPAHGSRPTSRNLPGTEHWPLAGGDPSRGD